MPYQRCGRCGSPKCMYNMQKRTLRCEKCHYFKQLPVAMTPLHVIDPKQRGI